MTQDVEHLLAQGSLAALRAAYIERRLSVVEAVSWYAARIESLDRAGPKLNAVRTLSPTLLDDAKAADRRIEDGGSLGPLHGVPILLKDNILAAGMRVSAGAAALRDFIPARDATLVRRLRAAGAIILGKTNMTEFADYVSDVMPTEFSGAGGIVRNPHGVEYGRGQGSSVGSAAAVAAALAPAAIGSETQNSIQAPACVTSLVGIKPSVGRASRAGIVPLVPSQDSPGPLARSVADAALILAAVGGVDVEDSLTLHRPRVARPAPAPRRLADVRIAVPRRTFTDRPDVEKNLQLFEDALSRLARAGAVIVDPCDLPSAEQLRDVRSCVFRSEFKAALNALLQAHDHPCGIASLDALIRWNEAHPEAIPYGQSLLIAAAEAPDLDSDQYLSDRARDVVLSRDAGIDAALAAADADVLIAPMATAAKCTGKAGAPVVALPLGAGADGLPFGVTLFAAWGDDARLVAIAALVEAAIGQRLVPALT